MSKISTLAIDLAKHSFQVCATTSEGEIIYNRKLSPSGFEETSLRNIRRALSQWRPCASCHYWGRFATGFGHEVKLIPPIYVKPFVKRNKNDANDAAAIATAVRQPDMRFCSC